MLSRITTLHFAPTEGAKRALLAEGIEQQSIHVTGNTVIDAQQWVCAFKGHLKRRIPGHGHAGHCA